MPYFKKKPIAIEAREYTTSNGKELARWCSGACVKFDEKEQYIIIPTLEGDMRSHIGDWIIKGVRGEFYSCERSIFEETYEPVNTGLQFLQSLGKEEV